MKINIKRLLAGLLVLGILSASLAGCSKTVQYTISFDSIGGSPVKSQTITEGDVVSKPEDPSKEGFTFVEWQLENTTYDFNAAVTQDFTLTAFYKINEGIETVLVVFDYQNNGLIKNVTIAKNTSMFEPPKPEKAGYVFEGWFYQDKKFDFTTNIDSNIVLTAKWKANEWPTDEPNEKPTNESGGKKTDNHSPSIDTSKNNTIEETQNKNRNIEFSLVEGVWYAEGHDDVTLKFSIQDGVWVFLDSQGYDYKTGIFEPNSGQGGAEYYYDNGEFYSEEIELIGKSKLIFWNGNNKAVFYRQKNYPTEKKWPYETLLSQLDGYYWYLDGYKYTYIKPSVKPWYDHEVLSWESENIQIYDNKLTAFENYNYTEYSELSVQAASNTHSTLMVNPITFADSLIRDYKMSVQGNKLSMNVGGKNYTFTKETKKRSVEVTFDCAVSNLTKTVGDILQIEVKASPFWACETISVTTNGSLLYPSSNRIGGVGGNYKIEFTIVNTGETQIIIQDSSGNSSKAINLKVGAPPPISVTGVQLNKTSLELTKGNTETLVATVLPSDAANKKVTWSSSNTSVVEVSNTGKVTAKGKGSATITVETADGRFSAQCQITVKEPPLSVSASIGIRLYSSDSSMVRGVFATVSPSGGSGTYTDYYIKLYYNGTLVAEGAKDEIIITPVKNGTYTAEVYVKDSSGNEARNITNTNISF